MGSLKPKYNTLKKTKEFKTVYENARKFVGKFFVMFVLSDTDEFKIGFVASKRVGNAINRNRAKRIMREIVRLNQDMLPNNTYMVMVARKNIINATNFKEINGSFISFISNIKKEKNDN